MILNIYYRIKPLIPRRIQIFIRRKLAKRKRSAFQHLWPIDEAAASPPRPWPGWPDGKRFAFILNHDVESAKGYAQCPKVVEIEKRLDFRSSFYFVPEGYAVSPDRRRLLQAEGFEVGLHGLRHDGKMFRSRKIFDERTPRINSYLKEWRISGFSSPSMHRNLEWVSNLDIEYDISTFDTDPFEPQPEGARTIYPFWVANGSLKAGFVELPYTLPQDHCLFVILREKDNRIWREKLDWIVEKGGMALINTHPDYMKFDGASCGLEEYPASHYADFLSYVKNRYSGMYWHALAREVACFWKERMNKDDRTQRIMANIHRRGGRKSQGSM